MSKGEETRGRILDRACQLAARDGLEGLSIGSLANELGLSKSGLFAHFGSKEELQLGVLSCAVVRFEEKVIQAALRAPRGEPRLRALLDHWMAWVGEPKASPGGSGCIFLAAATELDDRPGRARDYLVESQQRMVDFIRGAVERAIEVGHFRKDVDAAQFAFDFYAVMLSYHFSHRLLRDPKARDRARDSFERLISAARPNPR